jgi:nucleoside-diphosphate kinase
MNMIQPSTVDWSIWTVVLLKPDCVARGLVDAVGNAVTEVVTVVDRRLTIATDAQIRAHYADLLTTRQPYFTWVDVEADLRRTYVGQQVGIMLGHAPDAAARLRARLGHYDPSQAEPHTIRGRYGVDSLQQAQSEHRLIANLIHSSDDPSGAEREFGIWYGPAHRHLLRAPDAYLALETS